MGQNDRQNELQYQDVSTYLRAWYKGKKNDSPIELGSDLGYRSCHSLTVRYSVRYYQINNHLGTVHGSVRMSLPRHSVRPHGPFIGVWSLLMIVT